MKKLILFFLLFSSWCMGKTVHYELVATKNHINLSGKKTVDFAILLNQQIPAPVLEFTEGDTAVIKVTNKVKGEELSIHWHGLLLDPLMDGVPYVNTPPIRYGDSFNFEIPLRQHGTYWYHSHTGVQEQKGVYGAFIIHPKEKKIKADKELVVVLSDWIDESPDKVLVNLKKDGDYYTFKKGTMRSWLGAMKEGSLKNFLMNEWTRMGGMDLSDVGYDAFLINGKKNSEALIAHPGEKVRIRIINAGASSYFYLNLGNIPMKIIAADGIDINPVTANEILIGMAETYDVLFEIPEHKNYELKATAQDGTGSASTWIGMGEKVYAPVRPSPDLYAMMGHNGHEGHEEHNEQEDHAMPAGHSPRVTPSPSHHAHHEHMPQPALEKAQVQTLTVDDLKAKEKTIFPDGKQKYEITLELDGDMERYVWIINGKAIHQDRNIVINEGDIIRFTFKNNTMMHHPMHLHGHFFRVINKNGEYSPLKHTVDVSPHTSRTIEFYANEPGEWMLHCHNLYHMKTGMARVISYSSFKRNEVMNQYQKLDPHLHDHLYYRGMIEAATNHLQAEFFLLKTWDEIEFRFETRNDFDWEPEGDLFYKRWFNRFMHVIAGGTYVHGESAAVAGVGYILPMLLESHLIIDQKARLRLNLEKRFQWTKTVYTDAEFTFRQEQPSEFEISLMYQKYWSWSAGLMFTEKSVGIGAQYIF